MRSTALWGDYDAKTTEQEINAIQPNPTVAAQERLEKNRFT